MLIIRLLLCIQLLYISVANADIGYFENQLKTASGIEKVRILNKLSEAYWSVSPEKSVRYGEQAFEIANTLKDKKEMAIALKTVGVGYMNLGSYDKAINYYMQSLELAESVRYKEGISACLNNMAIVYDLWGAKDKALEYYFKSLKTDEEMQDKHGVATSLNNIGSVYSDLGNHEKALEYYQQALILSRETNNDDIIAMSLGNIGDRYFKSGDYEKAIGVLSDGLQINYQMGNKKGVASKLSTIGNIYKCLRYYDNALNCLRESMEIAESENLQEIIMDNYKVISEIYAGYGESDKAFDYYKKYSELKDKLLYNQIADKVALTESKFQIERKEQEKQMLELQLNRQTIIRNSLLASGAFIMIIVYIIYNRYRIRKKNHENMIVLSRLGQKLTASLNIEDIFQTFYDNVNKLMHADHIGVGIYNQDMNNVEFRFFVEDGTRSKNFIHSLNEENFTTYCIKNKKTIIINNIEREYLRYIATKPSINKNSTYSLMYLPLIAKNKILGLLTVQSYHKNSYSLYHLDILKTMASYLSIAMDNSEAYSYIESQKEKIEENLKVIQLEKDKSEKLLLNILPFRVAEKLKAGGKTEPESFNDVTVFFSDIVGFTNIASKLEPRVLISELNDLFTAFDNIMESNRCERIKTIGDAYLAVCGLPEIDTEHAFNIVSAAIDIIGYLKKRSESSTIKWEIRIGVHSGKVIGGVVGMKKYIYDVFGDTINTASRMETESEPMKINVSEQTYALLKHSFDFIKREATEVKGKGKMTMYFLNINDDLQV